MRIFVNNVVGETCVSVAEGWRVYRQLIPELRAGRDVVLDFAGAQSLGPSFFNASLGYLLNNFDVKELSRLVKVANLDSRDQAVLQRVLKNCRRFYKKELIAANHKILGSNDDARSDIQLPVIEA